jgi:hypothetical protein
MATTMLQPGDMLPLRRLEPLGGGEPVRIGSNQPRAKVLVVTHRDACDDCAGYLQSFEELADDLRNEKVDVLALVGDGWDDRRWSSNVPAVAADTPLLDRLAPDKTPVVAVVDRFGQLFTRTDAGEDHVFPEHERILSALLDIAIRCPECGVPDVPSPDQMPEAGFRSGGMLLGQ